MSVLTIDGGGPHRSEHREREAADFQSALAASNSGLLVFTKPGKSAILAGLRSQP
jgi:hypothetical protein